MYAAPPEMTAELFARLPESMAGDPARSHWAQNQHPGVKLRCFLEGPSFDRDGNLWVTDIPYGRLFRLSSEGEFETMAQYDGEPNGLKFHKDGRGFIADHANGIMVYDPKSGKVEPFLTRPNMERFFGCNDLVFAANGDLYWTDQGQSGLQNPRGRLWRLRTDGTLDCLLDNIPSPNGLVLNKAENQVLVAVTRANAVWRVRFFPDGRTVAKSGTFIQMSGGNGPDGMAIDDEENLAVAHVGLGSVWLFNAIGEPILRIRAPEGLHTTNIAYGGPDNRWLYFTESHTGSVYRARVDVPGRLMYGQM
ncbi:MAG: SMP-30/gluconolactonase/LRE family protein [Acetobacterales bacterium]